MMEADRWFCIWCHKEVVIDDKHPLTGIESKHFHGEPEGLYVKFIPGEEIDAIKAEERKALMDEILPLVTMLEEPEEGTEDEIELIMGFNEEVHSVEQRLRDIRARGEEARP